MTKARLSHSRTQFPERSRQRTFRGARLLQIAMPLGGIGAGCICLNGYGGLQDFSIRHRPATTAVPDGSGVGDAAFALLHVKGRRVSTSSTRPEPVEGRASTRSARPELVEGRPITRLVEGPMPPEKIYSLGLKGQGHRGGGHEGLPRFESCSFRGEYPFGVVSLADPAVPLAVEITGWSPFIPGDDRNSSLPCAILEYTLTNTSRRTVEYEFSYHLSDLSAPGRDVKQGEANVVIPNAGVFFQNGEHPNSEKRGSAALLALDHRAGQGSCWRRSGAPAAVLAPGARVKGRWFRGGWFDGISALWREVSTGSFKANDGSGGGTERNGGSVLVSGSLGSGESATIPVVIAWHFPNVNIEAGRAKPAACECAPAVSPQAQRPEQVRADEPTAPLWRPYYAGQWADARTVALYVREHYAALRERTSAFRDALFSSTLPPHVLDAVSANLAILKSPTVLRQENGNLWAWEGCFCGAGCCHGSCTHVWNYAQALAHLFPKLERTFREQELERSMDERGHVTFRAALPDGPPPHSFHAASDGQLGGILKLHRDWHISGDRAWLDKVYPLAKRSLDYCIAAWDPRGRGVLEEPHHNTYDIEFWGPDGMCSSIYIAALAAMAEMAHATARPDDAARYERLARKGARYLDAKLFNGEYYEQKVTYKGLSDKSFAEKIAAVNAASSDEDKLLRREGPKYQYASGCLSDGVIGAWMAALYGIETPLDREHVRTHLRAVFKHNFRADLWDHANTQRPGYALGHEPGLLLCSWPRGGKPTLPFPYSDEVWTGIEYQVASHLIAEGLVAEGLAIVRAARSRYDGRVRNPWNEYECGNYYARAMSSYALLGALAGFRYSAAAATLWLDPRISPQKFRTFFSAASGWGQCSQRIAGTTATLGVRIDSGELRIARIVTPLANRPELMLPGEPPHLATLASRRDAAPLAQRPDAAPSAKPRTTTVAATIAGEPRHARIEEAGTSSAIVFDEPVTISEGESLSVRTRQEEG